MQIDLEDRTTRAVVQEYVNAIINYQNEVELNFDIHKLIHTFEVVKIARELIELSSSPLSLKTQKQILNAAVLHDIARCYEFKCGKKHEGFNHGIAGAELIKKYFPELKVEQECTRLHNTMPSSKDPAWLSPILDFTRDADMLGNIRYNTEHTDIFLKHIEVSYPHTETQLLIDKEIQSSAKEKRPCIYQHMEKFELLDMMLAQLNWIFNLKRYESFLLSKQQNLFPKFRDAVIRYVLPILSGTDKQRRETASLIMSLFPDLLFQEVFEKHGV